MFSQKPCQSLADWRFARRHLVKFTHQQSGKFSLPITSSLSELEKLEDAVLLQADAMHKLKTY
jgi:hypothetical protein